MTQILFNSGQHVSDAPAMRPDPVTVRWATAQAAYEEDCRRRPLYHDGAPRKSWHKLGDVAQQSWYRNPMPREYRTV